MIEVAILEGTSCVLLPATTGAGTDIQLMDAPITPCTIVAPNPTLATSPTGATSWTEPGITSATPPHHKDPNPGMSSNAKNPQPHKPHCPKIVTIQDSHSDSLSDSDSDSDPLNY